jgi:hypothetical protein
VLEAINHASGSAPPRGTQLTLLVAAVKVHKPGSVMNTFLTRTLYRVLVVNSSTVRYIIISDGYRSLVVLGVLSSPARKVEGDVQK